MISRTPKPGDYGVVPGGGWPMYLVRLGTFSRYGHAALVVDVETPLRVGIVEATPDKGVRQRWLRDDELAHWRFSDFELSDEQRSVIVTAALAQLGKRYDWPSIESFLIRFWYKSFRGFDNDHPDDKLFCSELVAWIYRDFARFDLFPDIAPGSVSPGDLADRMLT